MICPKCGNNNPDSEKLCMNCGEELVDKSKPEAIDPNFSVNPKKKNGMIVAIIVAMIILIGGGIAIGILIGKGNSNSDNDKQNKSEVADNDEDADDSDDKGGSSGEKDLIDDPDTSTGIVREFKKQGFRDVINVSDIKPDIDRNIELALNNYFKAYRNMSGTMLDECTLGKQLIEDRINATLESANKNPGYDYTYKAVFLKLVPLTTDWTFAAQSDAIRFSPDYLKLLNERAHVIQDSKFTIMYKINNIGYADDVENLEYRKGLQTETVDAKEYAMKTAAAMTDKEVTDVAFASIDIVWAINEDKYGFNQDFIDSLAKYIPQIPDQMKNNLQVIEDKLIFNVPVIFAKVDDKWYVIDKGITTRKTNLNLNINWK